MTLLIHHEDYVAEMERLAAIREQIAAYRFAAGVAQAVDQKPRTPRFATLIRRPAASSAHRAAPAARAEAGD